MNCPVAALTRHDHSFCYWHAGNVIYVADGSPEQALPLAAESQCFAVDLSGAFAVTTPDEISVQFSRTGRFDDLALRWRLGIGLRVHAAVFGGEWLACATEETVQVYDATTGRLLSALSLASTAKVLRIFALPPGSGAPGFLAAVADDSTVVVWEAGSWGRTGASAGRASFARVIACDARLCRGAVVATVALADGRVAAFADRRMEPGAPPALLSFNAAASLGALASDASDATCVLEEGECAVGVEVLHEARLPADSPVSAMLLFVTQRRVIVAGLSLNGKHLRGIATAGLEELVGRPVLARECCLCPPAADPSPASLSSERTPAILIIGAVLGGKPICARIEHLLETAVKSADAFLESGVGVMQAADLQGGVDVAGGSCSLSGEDESLAYATPGGASTFVPPGTEGFGVDPLDDHASRDDGYEDDGDEAADGANNGDATAECVAERVPHVSSFLVQARPPDLLALAGEGSMGVTALSFEAQRRAGASGGGTAPQGAPVTFHARIRSSGYGAAPPRKPAWATKRAPAKRPVAAPPRSTDGSAVAAAAGSGSLLEARSSSYPSGRFPVALDDNAFPALAVSAAARGASVHGVSGGTQASRSLARSQAVVPCGPIAALAFRTDGSALAVASHDGSVHVLQVRIADEEPPKRATVLLPSCCRIGARAGRWPARHCWRGGR